MLPGDAAINGTSWVAGFSPRQALNINAVMPQVPSAAVECLTQTGVVSAHIKIDG
jgi:hypothetical protein